MSKKAGIFIFALCLVVSNIISGLMLADVGQAQEINKNPTIDKSMEVFQLQMTELLKMQTMTMTTSNKTRPATTKDLLGNWKAEFYAFDNGTCGTHTAMLTIDNLCGKSIFSGSIMVDNNTDTTVPIAGKLTGKFFFFSGSAVSSSLSGEIEGPGTHYVSCSGDIVKMKGKGAKLRAQLYHSDIKALVVDNFDFEQD